MAVEDNEQLKYLYERYLHNQCSREELQAFFNLVNALPDETLIHSLLSRTWDEAAWPPLADMPSSPLDFPAGSQEPLKPLTKRFAGWWKAAAVVAGAGLLLWGWSQLRSRPVTYTEKTTAAGQQLQVVLPDSSVVWLHAASKLRYAEQFRNGNREVTLEGKAFFDIRPGSQPFVVHSGGLTSTVLGTSFNIDAYRNSEHIAVTVISGRIKVADSLKVLDILLPAQQISYDRRRQVFAKTTADTTACLAWKAGKIRFEEETMGAIADELQRWYGVQFLFKDPALRNCRYTASFDNNVSLEKLLDVICAVNNIQYRINQSESTVTLSGKGCP